MVDQVRPVWTQRVRLPERTGRALTRPFLNPYPKRPPCPGGVTVIARAKLDLGRLGGGQRAVQDLAPGGVVTAARVPRDGLLLQGGEQQCDGVLAVHVDGAGARAVELDDHVVAAHHERDLGAVDARVTVDHALHPSVSLVERVHAGPVLACEGEPALVGARAHQSEELDELPHGIESRCPDRHHRDRPQVGGAVEERGGWLR